MPCYKPSKRPSIVVACCTLHNWICLLTQNDQLFREYEVEDLSVQGEEESTSGTSHSIDLSYESASTITACRNQIVQVMWENYIYVNLSLLLFLIINICQYLNYMLKFIYIY